MTRISLTDFAIVPNTGEDAVPALQRALAACRDVPGATLVVPPGRYDLFPEQAERLRYAMSNTEPIHPRTVALPLLGFRDFTLEADNASFVYHGRMMPIVVDGCRNLRLVGLTIDAAVPSVCQGHVVAVADDFIEILVEENADVRVEDGKLIRYGEGWYRAIWGHQLTDAQGAVAFDTGDGPLGTLVPEALGAGRFRLRKPASLPVSVGMYLILRSGWRDHSAIFIYRSRDIVLERITCHFANGTAILGQRSENVTMTNCDIVPGPGRVYGPFADATHWSGMRGQLTIEDCRFAGHLDDAANVHGTATVVREILSARSLVGAFAHWESVELLWAEPGDVVSFFSRRTLTPCGTAVVRAFTPHDAETFLLEFETDLPEGIDENGAMENLTWTPSFTFRNNVVRRHRARGILVSTPGHTVIERNRFSSPGAAIVIAGDANYWFESGAVQDVLIRNNLFDNCNTSPYGSGAGVIHIDPVLPEVDPEAPRYHRNITIEGNRFRVFDTPYLVALSVDGLTFRDNTILRTRAFPARIASPFGLVFDACRGVTVSGNRFRGSALGRLIDTKRMTASDIDATAWEKREANASTTTGTSPVACN